MYSMTDASDDVLTSHEEQFHRRRRMSSVRFNYDELDPKAKCRVSAENLVRHIKTSPLLFQEAALCIREGKDNDKFACHPTQKGSKMAYKILHHPIFHVFDLVLSVLLMLLALIENPTVLGTKPDEPTVVTVSWAAQAS